MVFSERNSIEDHNLQQIQDLNQRGGRMLSIVDLLSAGTLNLEMAAFLLYSQLENKSFLTAANPSGTGKTTLMGAMLNLLKPGIKIKTLTGKPDNTLKKADLKEVRFLIHELGQGPYYSYLWGQEAAQFFRLGQKSSLASCIHADTLAELKNIVFQPPISISQKELANIDLILFMCRERGGVFSSRRRVTNIYAYFSPQNEYKSLFEWDKESDSFSKSNFWHEYLKEEFCSPEIELAKLKKLLKDYASFFAKLEKREIVSLKNVRKKVLEVLTL
ncbi:MAG: hypothetical protein ACOCQ1_02125 [Halanaerobiaceae bacterium]